VFYSTDFRFIDYTIQTWNGTTWTTAATVTANTLADNTTPITGTSDRFRLVATTWTSPSPYYGPAITELTWTD
jgi:hypothetical protein